MRKGYLCDSTDYIRLVLWREYATLFDNGKTYTISNLKKSLWNNTDELHSSSTTAHKLAPDLIEFKEPDISSDNITVNPCSISGAKFTHTTKCLFCEAKILCVGSNSECIKCDKCGGDSLLSSTCQQKFWTLILNEKNVTTRVDVDADMLPDIEVDQVKAYLMSNKFKITYRATSGQINYIEMIKTEHGNESFPATNECQLESDDIIDNQLKSIEMVVKKNQ
eukprot:TCONS_00041441-protein